jgi:hypothetical protein
MKKLLIIFLIVNAVAINKSYSIIFTNCKAWSYSYFLTGKDTIVSIKWSGDCDADGFAMGKGVALFGTFREVEAYRYCYVGEMLNGRPSDGEWTFSDSYWEDSRTYDGIWTWKNGQINGMVNVAFYNSTSVGDFTNVFHIQGNFINGKPSGSFTCYDENRKEIGKVLSSKTSEVWKKTFLN